MIADPDALRDKILAFNPRAGPYALDTHPLADLIRWMMRSENMGESRAIEFAGRLRHILMRHSMEEVLRAINPDQVIDADLVTGRTAVSRQTDRGKLRRIIKIVQRYDREGSL